MCWLVERGDERLEPRLEPRSAALRVLKLLKCSFVRCQYDFCCVLLTVWHAILGLGLST